MSDIDPANTPLTTAPKTTGRRPWAIAGAGACAALAAAVSLAVVTSETERDKLSAIDQASTVMPGIEANAEPSADSALSVSRMAAHYNFMLAEGVTITPREREAFRWETPEELDVAAKMLASSLGIDGDVLDAGGYGWESTDEHGGWFYVGPDGSWTYNDYAAAVRCEVTPGAPDLGAPTDAANAEPAPVPCALAADSATASDVQAALAKAEELYGAFSSPNQFRYDAEITGDTVWVTAAAQAGGADAGPAYSMAWTDGKVSQASGRFGVFVSAGKQMGVSAKEALARLQQTHDQFLIPAVATDVGVSAEASGSSEPATGDTPVAAGAIAGTASGAEVGASEPAMPPASGMPVTAVSVEECATTLPDAPCAVYAVGYSDGVCGDAGAGSTALVDCPEVMPASTVVMPSPGGTVAVPVPEDVDVTLTSMSESMMVSTDSAGVTYWAPSYVFFDEEGSSFEVESSQTVYGMMYATEGVDTIIPGESDVSGAGETIVGDAMTGTVPAAGTIDTSKAEAFGRTLIGVREADAVRAAEQAGFDVRVAQRDGEGQALTQDYNPQRINLIIAEDVVEGYNVG